MSTVKAINLQHPSSASVNLTTDANGNVSSAGTLAMSGSFLRNRIINGAMMVDQRNGGAAVPNSVSYSVDRWSDALSGSGRYTAQQVTTAPAGFINSLAHTVTTAVSPAATDVYQIYQNIEGVNIADFAWGSASAKTVTVSFWVQSSITGLYAVRVCNNGGTRSYVSTYTISAANTWEYKTITIPGDTSGTWLTNTSTGISLAFDLGSGSNQNAASANVWYSGDYRRTASTVNWISTNGATFYLTGVQFEVGSIATPFEQRLYPQEFAMCQRYYQASGVSFAARSALSGTNFLEAASILRVQMRTGPTAAVQAFGGDAGVSSSPGIVVAYPGGLVMRATSTGSNQFFQCGFTADAEL